MNKASPASRQARNREPNWLIIADWNASLVLTLARDGLNPMQTNRARCSRRGAALPFDSEKATLVRGLDLVLVRMNRTAMWQARGTARWKSEKPDNQTHAASCSKNNQRLLH